MRRCVVVLVVSVELVVALVSDWSFVVLELVMEPLVLPLLLVVFSEELVIAVVSVVFDALVPLVPLTLVVLVVVPVVIVVPLPYDESVFVVATVLLPPRVALEGELTLAPVFVPLFVAFGSATPMVDE
jgi:hypothetical protein